MAKVSILSLVFFFAGGCSTDRGTVQTPFTPIEAWLQANAAPLLAMLNPPATEQSLAAFETGTGLKMPPEVRRLYLIHDGEADGSDGIFGCMKMLPLSEIRKEIELIGETGMIPICRSGGGDLYYVKSFDPAHADHRLREWWHENPKESREIAHDIDAFLADFAQELQRGQFVYRPDELAALIDRNEL
jgi:cell wall assembly regulator SMI1